VADLRLPRLYAILDADAAAERGFAPDDLLRIWFDAGIRLVQLRAKRLALGPFVRLAEDLARLAAAKGATFLVNDRADVARLSGSSGLHIGQDDLAPEDARRILLPTQHLGISTHNAEQLQKALEAGPAYVAFGPVYPTRTKQNPDPVVGLGGLADAASQARRHETPLVGIGGITLETARDLIDAGASAVAVIGDLLVGDPGRRAEEFLRRLEH
jgi:thiamine-phosphate pyrophosphorylase